MLSLILSELERIWHMKIVKGLIVLCFIVTAFCIYFLTLFDIGNFTQHIHTQLNAVNFSWFVLREVSLFIVLLFIPLLSIIVFNSEIKSKEYYLVMYRPFNRMKFLMSKWITLLIIGGMVTTGVFIAGNIVGFILYPMPEYVQFFDNSTHYSLLSGYLYTFHYYILFFLIIVAIISISSMVSLIMPNPMAAFFVTIATCIVPVYFTEDFLYLLLPTQSIFTSLASEGIPSIYGYIAITIMIFGLLSVIRWKKFDFN